MQTLFVKPFHWEFEDRYVNGEQLTIRVWCHDINSCPHLLRIDNFAIPCVVELPIARTNGSFIRWTASKAEDVHRALSYSVRSRTHIHPFNRSRDFCYKIPLFELQAPPVDNPLDAIRQGQVGTIPTFDIYTKSRSASYDLSSSINDNNFRTPDTGEIKLRIWHINIDPVTKLLAYRDVARCDWIGVRGVKITDESSKISTLANEYVVDWETICKVPEDICKEWKVHIGELSFDIEAYSPNHNKFVDRWDVRCHMYMITCNYRRGKERVKTRLLIMGDCYDFGVDDMEVVVVRTDSEAGLGMEFARVFQEFDPDIITGFRIQSFDLEYMEGRFAADLFPWPVLGRLKGVKSKLTPANKQSGAHGFNKMYDFLCPGRVVVDPFQYFRRDFKWREYNLNYISIKYLGEGKHDISAKEMFVTYEKMLCKRDDWKREMTEVAKYCVQDAQLVLRICSEISLWDMLVEMSNVMGINPYALYTSGQQIRCTSQLYRECQKRSVVINECQPYDFTNKGGNVLDPNAGLHNVACMDFNSLYPSIIICNNICYTTYVNESLRQFIPRDMCNITPIEYIRGKKKKNKDDDYSSGSSSSEEECVKTKAGPKKVEEVLKGEAWFIKKEYVEGMLPSLVGKLIDTRRVVQEELKKDPTNVTLDKKQLAVKVSANSFFGFLDATMLPFFPAAAAITSWGREYITRTINHIREKYGLKIVYGDTDSCMIKMPNIGREKYMDLLTEMCDDVTKLFTAPIKMKPEYCAVMFAVKKKKYALLKLAKDGSIALDKAGKPIIEVKGLLSARRDNCPWAADTFDWILEGILFRRPYIEQMDYLIDRVKLMAEGHVPYKQLLINKSVGIYTEKSKNTCMKVFTEKLRRMDKNIEPGERLYYLVTADPKQKLVGERMVLGEMYLDSLTTDTPYKLDYIYYIERVLQKHIDDIMPLAYPAETMFLQNRGIKYHKSPLKKNGEQKKNISYKNLYGCVGMMCEMLRGGVSLDELKYAIHSHLSFFDPKVNVLVDGIMQYA